MDNANARADEQPSGPETPEDVAILYSWANLPGAKYRDFSASRREYRAQQRARAAEAQRQTELQAARELEEAAQREIEEAQRQLEESRQAEAKAAADAAQEAEEAEAKRRAEEVLRRAEERAEKERHEAIRRQQSAEELRVLAERAQEEMLEARKRASEQAARYAEVDLQSDSKVKQQARVLPGETTDPYYYTGPVDPAYFASTPGVRTAQAARVSTERRSYVYPVHPGSDEYDAGTIVSYRGTNPFGPAPQQPMSERNGLLQEVFEQPASSATDAPAPPARDDSADTGYDLDDDYYDGDHVTRTFAPSPRSRFAEGLETAAPDLHIRPATRVSGDHERQARTVRPSPLPQALRNSAAEPIPSVFGQEETAAGSAADAPTGVGEFAPVFRSSDVNGWHAAPMRETTQADTMSGVAPQRGKDDDRPVKDLGRMAAPLYPEPDDSGEDIASSRMFIPSPRRRMTPLQPGAPTFQPVVSQPLPVAPAMTPAPMKAPTAPAQPVVPVIPASVARAVQQTSAEPAPEETRLRDAAAAEGERRTVAEVERREAQDRFTREQQGAKVEQSENPVVTERPATVNVAEGMPAGTFLRPTDPTPRLEEPVHWRSLNRAGESGYRRRRQPGREPVARTARQPRTGQGGDAVADGLSQTEPAAPPAWLSAERPVARQAELPRVEGIIDPDLPASPGDPGVPVPRPVIRRQTSGLRPRQSSPAAPAASTEPASDTANATSLEKPGQERKRVRDDRAAEPQATSNDTLQQSRERVASRWFALSGLMGADGRQGTEPRSAALRSAPHPAPVLCVLSISGGVGKTSIVATLGRALSSLGEKVMLADTSVHGILPYYFGAREQRPGAVRTFSPPPGSSDAPVVLVSYDADGRGHDEAGQASVLDDLYRRSSEVQRVLVDAGVNSAWLARTVAGTNPWVLVPVAPDMNSVLGTQSVERLFQGVTGADGRPVRPYYVLNQYDPSVPLHLDVREVLRQFLGERLLPIMLHRTPAVSEALAEGMTVIDYAPRTPIAHDYMNLATWVRKLADPGLSYARPARWSER